MEEDPGYDFCDNPDHGRDLRAARAMAAAIDIMVHRGQIDPRHFAADARLLFGDRDEIWPEDEAVEILRKTRPNNR